MPVFVSVFMGLRGMANVPLDSLKTGGLFWFTDLTLADQYYLLPIVTSATLWATIEVCVITLCLYLTIHSFILVRYRLS